ncbi:MAG: iron ABC transporter permease, partial [Trichococcus flocculiformis]
MGYSSLPLDRILQVLSGNGVFKENYVFYQIRFPRALVLTMAGACLAGAGIILQTLSNNDLADSGLLGINSGAGLGVTIFYLFAGEGMLQFSAVLPLVAFISALVAASAVYLLSYSRSHKQHAMQLVVIGAGISSAFSGLIVLLMSASDRTDVSFIAAWMSGNIWGSTWPFVFTILPGWLLAMGVLFLK